MRNSIALGRYLFHEYNSEIRWCYSIICSLVIWGFFATKSWRLLARWNFCTTINPFPSNVPLSRNFCLKNSFSLFPSFSLVVTAMNEYPFCLNAFVAPRNTFFPPAAIFHFSRHRLFPSEILFVKDGWKVGEGKKKKLWKRKKDDI